MQEWGEDIGSAVPLYLVTTAALALRGSWKLTVRDTLLVTMRQALVGTSGAPGTEEKAQRSSLSKSVQPVLLTLPRISGDIQYGNIVKPDSFCF